MLSRSLLVVTSILAVSNTVAAQTSRTCAVQGSTQTPPALGARVTVGGVVTATFRGGFFLQDPTCDGNRNGIAGPE